MSSSSVDDEATISIPSLAFVAVIGFFIYRFFFSRSGDDGSGGSSSSSSRNNGLRFTPAQVEQIAQMFPQLNRRDIMWDLHRNRGSVQATTERVLMGRGLDPVSLPT
jgi:coupling of ubiquitin conjugation to ER degradation protein 1